MPELPAAVPDPKPEAGPRPFPEADPPVTDEDEDLEGASFPTEWPALQDPADDLEGGGAVPEAAPPPAWMFDEPDDASAPGVDAWEEDLEVPPLEVLGDPDIDAVDLPD